MSNRIGQQLGSYHLIRFLGEGVFGDVYYAEQVGDQTPVAVKVFKTRLTPDQVKVFIQDIHTVLLKHPHIVQVIGFGIQEGSDIPYLVMEHASHGTLRQRHPKGTRLPLDTIVSYVKQIASALQYAHDHKLVHRDVKPENILLGPAYQIWLSDFGMAVVAHGTASQRTEEAQGTARYMAPEQWTGKPQPASDQYALGLLTYEWLCGESPFQEGTVWQWMHQHLYVPPPPLHEKMSIRVPVVEHVVMTALAKDPRQRFASVEAFANALTQAITATTALSPASSPAELSVVRAGSAPPAAKPAGGASRRNVVVGLVVAGLTIVGGSLIWQISSRRPLPPGQTPTPVQHPSPTPVPISQGHFFFACRGHQKLVRAVAWSPDGKRIASGSNDTTVQVWEAATGGHLFTYHGHSTLVNAVAWSPDGKHIASGSSDRTVQVWDATDGSHILTYHGHSANPNGHVNAVAWSPNSNLIASGSDDTTVQIWEAVTGGHLFTYSQHQGSVRSVAWSPNGKRIASGSDDTTVQVWEANAGGRLFTYRGHSNLSTNIVEAVVWSPDNKHIASGDYEGTVQVWEATTGLLAFPSYTGHAPNPVLAVAWSSDGKHIASGGTDNTVQVWNAETGGDPIYPYHGHRKYIDTVAWSPDNKRIASAGFEGTVQVWEAE